MRKIVYLILTILICTNVLGQNKAYLDYIATYKDIAQQEMRKYGIPASITLAQGLLESGGGKSRLALEGNNHFGIKCQNVWTGETISHDDDAKGECFRKYPAAIESYEDHSKFLVSRPRYAFLFEFAPNDYKAWAFGLKQAGYASDPNYPARLIKIIEDYKLNALDSSERVKKEETDKTELPTQTTEAKVEKKTPNKESFFTRLFGKSTPAPKDENQEKIFADRIYIAEIDAFRTHTVQKINGVKCIIAKEGDSYASVADEFELYEKELLKANEVQYGATLIAGDIVYFSKKKKTASIENYIFKEGDTMYAISQLKGIRVRSLYRLNGLIYGNQPAVGTLIKFQ